MTRVRDEQGARILSAASELLSTEGPGALSVRRIATLAGCSTMGLYSRFGSKEGVVDELYAEGFEHLRQAMFDRPTTDDPVADLRGCARTYRATALAHATHYMVMFGGAVPGFVPSAESQALAMEAFGRLVASVARCVDAGRFHDDPTEIAEILWGSIHGLVMLELVGIAPKSGEDADTRYERALDVLFAGMSEQSGPHA